MKRGSSRGHTQPDNSQPHNSQSQLRLRAFNALLEAGLVLAWSSAFIGAILASQTPSVFQVLLWRFLIIATLLAPFLIRAARLSLGWRWYGVQALLGLIGMFGCLACGVKAIDLGVPAGTAALIAALQPLLTAALAGPLLKEPVTLRQWIGLALGLVGVGVAVGDLSRADTLGYLLAFGSMLSIVIATLIAKAHWDNSHFLPAFSLQSAVAAICFLPLAWADGALMPSADPLFAAAVLWAIVLSTGGGYGLYYLCLERTSAVRVGSLIYLTPPVTMIWAFLMYGQPLEAAALIGFVICLAGVALARGRQA